MVKCISQEFDDRAVESGDKEGSRGGTVVERLSSPNGSDRASSKFHVGECANEKATVSKICCHNT